MSEEAREPRQPKLTGASLVVGTGFRERLLVFALPDPGETVLIMSTPLGQALCCRMVKDMSFKDLCLSHYLIFSLRMGDSLV